FSFRISAHPRLPPRHVPCTCAQGAPRAGSHCPMPSQPPNSPHVKCAETASEHR
ncbi:unnamed protein product, partial [Bubo scandiacus]